MRRRESNLIFVSIAAYRDPQLEPTVADCLHKAAHPERLRFGICWQHAPGDAPLSFRGDPRFRVHEVDWRESQGACWARAEIMKLWQDEGWFLQVDSHCRFSSGWDTMLLRAARETGSEKPVLSTYATPFTPGPNEILAGGPLQMAFQAFTPEGIPQLKPADLRQTERPVRARFLSAGFLFAPGYFVCEVPYDPELYFMGEEAAMTVRAFTHGYDLFHPAETVVWHDYLRANASKHWGDHSEANRAARPWGELDRSSKRKVERLLLGEPVEPFGLGTARTLDEYEAYAGLSFRLRKAQQYTVRAQEPPNPAIPAGWAENIHPWIARIVIERAQLPPGSLDDPELWYLGIEDGQGYEICRRDFTPDELAPLQQGSEERIALICEFPSESMPARWTVWPVSRSRGWLNKLQGRLRPEDFAILSEEDDDEPEEGE